MNNTSAKATSITMTYCKTVRAESVTDMNNPISECCAEPPLGEIDLHTSTGRCGYCFEGTGFIESEEV